MTDRPFALWVYLSTQPLLWLTVTVGAWVIADRVAQACGRHPIANPVLIAIVLVATLLATTATPYRTYFEGAQFVHFLLGPATVALAVPLVRHWPTVRRNLVPMIGALAIGSVVAIVSAVGIAMALGVPREVLIALAPKSVTAAVAMGVTETLGGEPALTAVLVITTGIIGAVMVTPLMNALGCATTPRAGSPSASPRTASARRARFPSTLSRARSPGSRWGSTRWRPRCWCRS